MSGVRRGRGWTPIMYAAAAGDLAAVTLLIQHEADVNARDVQTGITPLMLAASGGHAKVVTKLLDHGAEPRATDIERRDASHHAAHSGHDGLVKELEFRAFSPALTRDLPAPKPLEVDPVGRSPRSSSDDEGGTS